jgi:hypothetical protein
MFGSGAIDRRLVVGDCGDVHDPSGNPSPISSAPTGFMLLAG